MTGAQKAEEEARMRVSRSAPGGGTVAYCVKMQMPCGGVSAQSGGGRRVCQEGEVSSAR